VGTENTTISLYGGTYTGEMLNGIPDGLGLWMHPDGQAYIGKWVYGDFNGYAALTLPEGETYVGSCRYDRFFSPTDGPTETGPSHKSCLFHGQGTLSQTNGTRFVGEWRLGKFWNGSWQNNNKVLSEIYSEGVRTPIFLEQKLSPAAKKQSNSFMCFFFIGVPAVVGTWQYFFYY